MIRRLTIPYSNLCRLYTVYRNSLGPQGFRNENISRDNQQKIIVIYDISVLWTSEGLNPPNEKADPVDYFFEHIELRKDPEWNDFVDDNPKLNLTKN